MNEAFKAILYQALGYSVAMFIAFGILGFLQRGFLLKFLKVKSSLGRKVLIRVREVAHWVYYVGDWNEQDLVFGGKKGRKRINNVSGDYIYRSLGINWVDLDGKSWAILPPASVDGVTGFDPEKQESLVTRALYKPPIEDVKQNLMLVLIIVAIIASAISAYFGFNILNKVGIIEALINTIQTGGVVPTG